MNVKIIDVSTIDRKKTAKMAEKALNLPRKLHTLSRIYKDGTVISDSYHHNDIYNAIAYNAIFRCETSIVVDDILVFNPSDTKVSDVLDMISNLHAS